MDLMNIFNEYLKKCKYGLFFAFLIPASVHVGIHIICSRDIYMSLFPVSVFFLSFHAKRVFPGCDRVQLSLSYNMNSSI